VHISRVSDRKSTQEQENDWVSRCLDRGRKQIAL